MTSTPLEVQLENCRKQRLQAPDQARVWDQAIDYILTLMMVRDNDGHLGEDGRSPAGNLQGV